MNTSTPTSTWVIRIAVAGFLSQLALSWPLWFPEAGRRFPLLPLFGLGWPESESWHLFQIAGLLAFALLSALFSQQKKWLVALLVWLIWLILQDQNRLQPWTYFYLLVLAAAWGGRNETDIRALLQWLLAGVYFWSGLNKMTPYYAVDNFPWFCEAFVWTKPLAPHPALGYASALAEMLLAAGLLWPKTRPAFRYLALGFHVYIIAALSPLGLDWNYVVIPWNMAMAGLAWLVFKDTRFAFPQNKLQHALLALAWLFPALNIWHLWDESLSWKMYSNTQPELTLFSDTGAPCKALEPDWQQYAFDAGSKLLIDDWTMAELHTPPYASTRTFRQLGRYLCRCAENPDQAGVYVLRVERWDKSAETLVRIPCLELLKPAPNR